MMFYVKGIHRQGKSTDCTRIVAFTEAIYIGHFHNEGLSFVNSARSLRLVRYKKIFFLAVTGLIC